MISQNLLNLIDTAMVGTLGNSALAAVGVGGFATFMCQAILTGLSVGVQTTSARRKGEGKIRQTAAPLNAGLLIILCVAPVLSVVIYQWVPSVYPYLNDDPQVIAQGVPYLQVRIITMVFAGINFAFRGYWNAVDLPQVYMKTLLTMHVSNVALNYLLIFGHWGFPALGVQGAGLASALATGLGTLMCFALGLRHASRYGFLRGLPQKKEVWALVHLSLPTSGQQFFFAAGFTALYWIIGQVGTAQLAAANVLINVVLIAILPGIALGISSATLVGQALGRGEPEDARKWGWDVVKVGIGILGLLGIPMWSVPEHVLSVFLHDPATVQLAKAPMRLFGFMVPLEAVALILMHSLLGAGDSKRVMLVSIITQWAFFLPLAYCVGPLWGFGLFGIWLLQVAYRAGLAVTFAWLWVQGRWQFIHI